MKDQDKNSEKNQPSKENNNSSGANPARPTSAENKGGIGKRTSDKDLPYNPEVTQHDLDMLSQDNVHGDGGDDQQLKDRKDKIDFAGDGLDIPGRRKARESGKMGLPDEENQLYSQGGDDKENLERDDSAL